jgi:NAD(P)-dependent dehydrogenase (short-subunit alcohol dehydrogenase family)
VRAPVPTTLITGGATALGYATGLRLANRGDQIILADHDESGVAYAAAQLAASGGRVRAYVVDERDRPAVERMCADVDRRYGGVTYLLRTGGVHRHAEVSDTSLDSWNEVLEAELTGAFHVCQAVLPLLIQQRHGAIVLNSSDQMVIGVAGEASHRSAMAGLFGLSKALAVEFAQVGIRVNAIGPSPLAYEHGAHTKEWPHTDRAGGPEVLWARDGTVDEVASVVEFLLSERARYITGQVVQPKGADE